MKVQSISLPKPFLKNKPRKNPIFVIDETGFFINKNTTKLVVGTMISFDGRYAIQGNAKIRGNDSFDFFYPNRSKNNFWELLKYAVSEHSNLLEKKEKEALLESCHIGMVNLIHKATCVKGSSKDADIYIEELRHGLLEEIINSKISDIYFTGKTARRLFWYYMYNQNWQINLSMFNDDDFTSIKITDLDRKINLHTFPTPANYLGSGTIESKKEKYKKILGLFS